MVGELFSIALFCLPALLGLFFVLFRMGILRKYSAPIPEISVPQMLRASRAQWIAAEHELMRGWEMQCNCSDPTFELEKVGYSEKLDGPSSYCFRYWHKDYRCRIENPTPPERDTVYVPTRSGPYSPARKSTRPVHQA